MKITESDFADQILSFVNNQLGSIFFFNHIAVVELNEGIHFNRNNAFLIIDELKAYFGDNKPFGVVANRINSYSVDLLDTPLYRSCFQNLKAYGVVGHNPASKMNAELENDFCASEKVDYDTMTDALNDVFKKVKSSKFFSLN